MKFDIQSPLIEGTNSPDKRIVCLQWSPDGERLAVATTGRLVNIFRSNGGDATRFPVKARDESSNRNFTITGLSWAPDSCRLAISQSDMAVAVYDIGPASSPDSRKKITLRFSHKSSILCVTWPISSINDFVYGLSDGSIMCGLTKMKKTEELYKHTTAPLSIASSSRMNAVIVGHVDGNVFMVNLDTRSRTIALQTSSPPQALAWGSQVLAAGSDLQINFSDPNGTSSSHVDYSNQTNLRSFTSASFDPSGTTAIVAGRNSLYTFNYSTRLQSWTEQSKIEFDGLYSVPSLSWSPDGSKIAVASSTGSVFLLTASIGSFKYKDLFEVIHITGSQIKVIDLKNSKKELFLKSDYRILSTNFYQNRYIVSRTTNSFLFGDIFSLKTSELQTSLCDREQKITEKFIFIDDIAILVWNLGELTIIEFGKQNPLASITTQYANNYLLSLRFNVQIGRNNNSKILAYLIDSKTIRIINIETLMTIDTVQIPFKIDWLELNVSGTMLLFRDAKRQLYLYNIESKNLNGILNSCNYAQWVPDANVVVAQSKKSLYVWYSPTSPDEVQINEIEGDVIDTIRKGTKTSVIISSNGKNINFPLDGSFISFSAAIESKKLKEAAKILLQMKMSINLKALWTELAEISFREHDFLIAEISYSNIGDLSKARFLHKINKNIEKYGINHCLVQAQISMLQSNFKQAEYCLIEHDQLDEAINMYKSMHMWNELLDLTDLRCPNRSKQFRDEYYAHLLETNQYQTLANLKAKKGEINEAIDLCLQGNKPQLAAEILLNNNDKANPQILTHVAESLIKNNRFDLAGQIYEKLGNINEALTNYRKGHSYYKALDLAKVSAPELVIEIEHEWGDYLVSQGQNDAATFHYIESGDYSLALNCSLRAQQWNQAAEILRNCSSSPTLKDELKLQYLRVGRYFASIKDINTAEDLFLTVDAHKELIEMYLNCNKIDDALRHAKRHMKQSEYEKLFIQIAKKNEKKESTRKIAENIYLAIKKPELAIEMYNSVNDSENVLRLTSQFGGNKEQLINMAIQAEREGNLELAENCYIRSGEYEKAIFMYRQEKKFSDALRIAKQYGKKDLEIQVAVYWALSIGGEAGVKKLQQLNLIEKSLLYCSEQGIYDLALQIMKTCKTLNKNILKLAHTKIGTSYEAQNKFEQAELHYIAADQPREAVEMYVHQKMWNEAQRVANKYGITDIPLNPTSSKTKTTNSSTSNTSLLKKAMYYEEQHQYEDAISTYLSLTVKDCGSEERYDQVLERAVKLSANFCQNKLPDVVTSVAQLLISLNRHKSLGKILESIEAYADAIEIYKMANMWDDALPLINYLEPEEQEKFQQEYQEYLATNSDTKGLINIGKLDAALEVYAQKGQWNECLTKAKELGAQYLEKYTMLYSQELINQKKYDEAISVLAKYSPSSNISNIPSYISLCKETIYSIINYDNLSPSVFAMRQMLYKIIRNMNNNTKDFNVLQHFTIGIHLLCQQHTCYNLGLNQLLEKIAISLLRYSNILPSDYLFYKAGDIMKNNKKIEFAIIFFTRFLEISEVISNGDLQQTSQIDYKKFEGTDIPRELCLRKQHAISSDVIAKINDWVLEMTINEDVEPKLPLMQCPKCKKEIFMGNLKCNFCGMKFDCCCITGAPVLKPVKCTACGAVANRTDWGLFVSKTGRCPCCDTPQTASA
ncbi:selective LIM binding factor [Histomonas meleagridis]|uniref:selective LIM binding factor n=1 Tax=Histomonas meleagridis TaxID=135588 RepID=UPI00355A8F81|nr:selective LIM binding factor [Histomonas meleagridis]KAH0797332.1 selective LIM binding factor [Histomonas meleagridis]